MPTDNELLKMRSGGAITSAEYDRLKAMPHKERYGKSGMKKPESGGKPKRITTEGKPGATGPGGARSIRKQRAAAAALRQRSGAAVTPKEFKKTGGKPPNPHRGAKKTPTGSSSVGGY